LNDLQSLAIISFVLVFLFGNCFSSLVTAQQDDVSAAISVAQSNITSCFDAARAAEKAGANISRLTNTLNNAEILLSNARCSYSTGDYATAQSLAAESQSLLSNFITDANYLKIIATQNHNIDVLVNVDGSIVGTIAVLFGGFMVWRFIKRNYSNNKGQNFESTTV
jgi:hypothetical protein